LREREEVESLENKLRLIRLYDIYGDLLTEKQKQYFQYSYFDDYSLAEVADIMNVSRNAVFDQLKIVVAHLEEYEQVLQIMAKAEKRKAIIEKISRKSEIDSILALVKELEKLEE